MTDDEILKGMAEDPDAAPVLGEDFFKNARRHNGPVVRSEQAVIALFRFVEEMIKIPGSEHAMLLENGVSVKSWGEGLIREFGELRDSIESKYNVKNE